MKKVAVFGTFDRLHQGHLSFFRQAKKLGGFLLVIVARDYHVEKAKSRPPQTSEKIRARDIKKVGLADRVILGSKTHNFYRTLRTHEIDIIALGYDQKPNLVKLKKELNRHRLGQITVVRLRPLRPEIYKSSKLPT